MGEEFDKIDENGGEQVVTIIALLTSILIPNVATNVFIQGDH